MAYEYTPVKDMTETHLLRSIALFTRSIDSDLPAGVAKERAIECRQELYNRWSIILAPKRVITRHESTIDLDALVTSLLEVKTPVL